MKTCCLKLVENLEQLLTEIDKDMNYSTSNCGQKINSFSLNKQKENNYQKILCQLIQTKTIIEENLAKLKPTKEPMILSDQVNDVPCWLVIVISFAVLMIPITIALISKKCLKTKKF
ncbi:hypothetical protein BpHYR1_014559 [Brachionus plicatilis]|uniref:Uncharacterized protein n=1 Tax=Brachionus plicatilis TaxID=10195 RepID=A0A3M7PTE1_BRAPC|nr:hypothetical protein BpHYR1_014559 [Brachionus plicatilis]